MIQIEKIIPGGQALATLPDGKKIFLWGALPGEVVKDYTVTKTKSHFVEAIAQAIENSSPHRVQPKDACWLSTSPWQILDYQYELSLKQSLVVEIFREHQINIPLPEIITDNKEYFYRNKMEYSLYWDTEEAIIKLSFHQRGTHRKIPIDHSSLERPEIFQKATDIVNQLNNTHEEARKYQSLLLRCNQNGEVSGGLYENHRPHPIFPNLRDLVAGYEYSYSPNGFFQINLPVYELALHEIAEHIATDEVLDLYAGVGTIGLSVARDTNLTLVEVDKNAFRELANNITIRNTTIEPIKETDSPYLGQATIRHGNLTAILDKSENVTEYLKPNQTIILDPPRSGCDSKLINKLFETCPATIIYLSCNPATQARDIKQLLTKYRIKTIKTYNFFPHTPHIENLTVLSLK